MPSTDIFSAVLLYAAIAEKECAVTEDTADEINLCIQHNAVSPTKKAVSIKRLTAII